MKINGEYLGNMCQIWYGTKVETTTRHNKLNYTPYNPPNWLVFVGPLTCKLTSLCSCNDKRFCESNSNWTFFYYPTQRPWNSILLNIYSFSSSSISSQQQQCLLPQCLLTPQLTVYSSTAVPQASSTTPATGVGWAMTGVNSCKKMRPYLYHPQPPLWILVFLQSLITPLVFSITLSPTYFPSAKARNSFASTSTPTFTPTKTLLNLSSLSLQIPLIYWPISALSFIPRILHSHLSWKNSPLISKIIIKH